METEKLDLERTCRTCKQQGDDMVSLFELSDVGNDNSRIDEMLMACTGVQIREGDGMPLLICKDCLEKLKTTFTFKKQCQEVEDNLKQYIRHLNIELIHQEISKEIDVNHIKKELQDAANSLSVAISDSVSEQDPLSTTAKEPEELSTQFDYIRFINNTSILLICRECYKVFTTLDGLRGHKRLHVGDLFKCRYCGKGYTRQTHVERHEATHKPQKVHICKICNKTLTRVEHLKRHLTTHLKHKPYSCKICNRGFNRSDHLDLHTVRCKGDRLFICDICNRGFSREDSMEVHKKLHENQQPILPTLDNIDNIAEHYYEIDRDSEMLDTATNSDCDDYFEPLVEVEESNVKKCKENEDHSLFEDIKITITNDHEMDENIINKIETDDTDNNIDNNNTDELDEELMDEFDNGTNDNQSEGGDSDYMPMKHTKKRGPGRPRKYPPGRRKRSNKSYTCETCNKTFSRLNLYKRHLNSHSTAKPYSCETCNRSFTRRDHLTQHMKIHEKHEFECDICQKTFNKIDQLEKHKTIKHTLRDKGLGDKKYECHMCSKTFTTEKYRDIHVSGHLGEKRFKCKTCEKCFLSKSHLNEHMKFHNENSKKFLCSECGQRFIRNDYLVIHMRRHRGEKPFKCKYCGKGFPRTTDLTVHERYHTGEKTHLCTICGRGFGRAYNLTVHMRTHTGEKPYQCTYCDAAFAQGNDLKAHVRRHTGERFQCELCAESFLMGYLLTQHKRTVHGLNVVSNIRRLQPINKIKQDVDEPPPITIPLPKPVIPEIVLFPQLHQRLTRE